MKEGTLAEGVVGVGGIADIVLEGPVADRLGVKAAIRAAKMFFFLFSIMSTQLQES